MGWMEWGEKCLPQCVPPPQQWGRIRPPRPLLPGREEPSVQRAARSQPGGEESRVPPLQLLHVMGGGHTQPLLVVTGSGCAPVPGGWTVPGTKPVAVVLEKQPPQPPPSPGTSPGTAPQGWDPPPRVAEVIPAPCPPRRGPSCPFPPPEGQRWGGGGSSGSSREGVGTANNKIYPVKSSTAPARCLPGNGSAPLRDAGGCDGSCPPKSSVTLSPAGVSHPPPCPRDGGGCRARSARLRRGHAGTTQRVRVRRVGAAGSGVPGEPLPALGGVLCG